MTSQEKKKTLKSYAQIEKRVNELRNEIDLLWKTPTSVTSNTEGIPRGGNGDGTKTELAYERIEKLNSKLEQEIDEMLLLEYRIVDAIQKLPDIIERRVLTLAYIGKVVPSKNGKTVEHKRLSLFNIARELAYSHDWVKHIHGSALMHIEFFE